MDTPNYSGDQLAQIVDFRTRAGELADLLESLQDGEHNQNRWATVTDEGNGVCGTPRCALGWAVHRGLVPDARIGVFTRFKERLGVEPSTKIIDDVYGVEITGKHIEPEKLNTYGEVVPVTGNTASTWAAVGLNHFGSVVLHAIFYKDDMDSDETIRRLREYVTSGEVTIGSTRYYHSPVDLGIIFYLPE